MRWRVLVVAGLVFAGCYHPGYQAPGSAPQPTEVVLSGGEGTEVLAEGVAALTGSPDIARDQALRDALRKAVEQGVGSFINTETRVQNFQLLDDRIYSQATGYVSSYRVITESREGELYRVVVRAMVKTDRIEDDLAAIGLLVSEQGRPRLMVVLESDAPAGEVESAETALLTIFTDKGFPVVDRRTVQRNIDAVQRLIAGDTAAALRAGLRTGAEIGIFGQLAMAQERKKGPYQQAEADFYRVSLNLRAVDLLTGEVLGGSSQMQVVPFSRDEALKGCVESSADALLSSILQRWQRRENITQIFCRNASYQKVAGLGSELRTRVRGIKQVISRELSGDEAVLEVVSETPSSEILAGLGKPGFVVRFEIIGWSGNRIEIKFIE